MNIWIILIEIAAAIAAAILAEKERSEEDD